MKWISVKDELPKETEKGTPVIAAINNNFLRVYGHVVISIYYKGKFHKDFHKGFIQNITHWMPLPEPPKK